MEISLAAARRLSLRLLSGFSRVLIQIRRPFSSLDPEITFWSGVAAVKG